jgi:hypothetical protein
MGLWPFKNKQDEMKALPAPERPAEDKTFPPPVRAKYGTYFATRTFVNTQSPDYEAVKMEAVCHSGGWRLIRTDMTGNFLNPQEKPDEIVHKRTVDKSNDCLTFWDAIRRMSEFNAEMTKLWTPVGPTRDEMGMDHFQNLALREGTVGFDANGLAFVTHEGKIPSAGFFFDKDLVEVLRAYESGKDLTETGRRNMFADIFNVAVGPGTDYRRFTQDMQLKGYIEELIGATADIREVLSRFNVYFEGEQRRQTVDQWLKQARADLRSTMLPEKFRSYSLTIKDILESKALKDNVSEDGEYALFADALKKMANGHANSLGEEFRADLKRFESYAGKIGALLRDQGRDKDFAEQAESIFNPAYLDLFRRKLELTYHVFRAKAQYEFLTHVKGDKTEYLASLDETVQTVTKLLKSIDSSGRAASFTADEIISMPRPNLAFIDRLIEEFNAGAGKQAARIDENRAASAGSEADWTWKQLALPFESGESGLTRHKLELDLDGFLAKVKAEKGEKFAAEMMEQIGSLALLNSSVVDTKKATRLVAAANSPRP